MTEQTAITFEDAQKKIREIRKSISETDIYYKLKARGIQHVKEQTVESLAWCLSINRAGFPVTVNLVATLSNRDPNETRTSLHILGDKNLLTLLRGFPIARERALVWRVKEKLLDIDK